MKGKQSVSKRIRKAAAEGRLEEVSKLLFDHAASSPLGREGLVSLAICAGWNNYHLFFVRDLMKREKAQRRFVLDDATPLLLRAAELCSDDENGQASAAQEHNRSNHTLQEIVSILLDRGVSPDCRDIEGRTSLMVTKSTAVAELLVAKRADIFATDNRNRTTLMHADTRGLVELLLGRAANISKQRQINLLAAEDALGRSALMTSLELCADSSVPLLLIQKGANVRAADTQGRTVLIYAAWRNHVQVVDHLLEHHVSVHEKDYRDRKIWHHLAENREPLWDAAMLDVFQKHASKFRRDDYDAKDYVDRRPLHWAAVTGNVLVANMLLDCGVAVNAQEHRKKTPLHLAADNGRPVLVEKLLQYGANIFAEADGGWTPLHYACAHPNGITADEIVERLLEDAQRSIGGTQQDSKVKLFVNKKLDNNKTPLHLACEAGNIEVVRRLLAMPEVESTHRDKQGNTPLLTAAHHGYPSIARLLAPWTEGHINSLSDPVKKAAKEFEATIMDFDLNEDRGRNHHVLPKVSVYDLLYSDPDASDRFSTVPKFNGRPTPDSVRWIHVPANNAAWCHKILTKRFIEEGVGNTAAFKSLIKSFESQHRGELPHGTYMRPTAQLHVSHPLQALHSTRDDSVIDPQRGMTDEDIEELNSADPTSASVAPTLVQEPSQISYHSSKSQHRSKSPRSIGPRGKPKQFDWQTVTSGEEETSEASHSNIFMFMPYVHFEKHEEQKAMHQAITRYEPRYTKAESSNLNTAYLPPASGPGQGLPRPETRDELLLRAHLTSFPTSLHVRRTLDQYFHRTIDTRVRDRDQVIHRWQAIHAKQKVANPRVLMIDQLWMWILGENLIITSFPRRWGKTDKPYQAEGDHSDVLDCIREHLESSDHQGIHHISQLAMIIAHCCSNAISHHFNSSDEFRALDMFEASIGRDMQSETKMFKDFKHCSKAIRGWLLSPPDRRHRKRKQTEVEIGKMLDVKPETVLVEDIKDIQDELDMLHMVLSHQLQVAKRIQEAFQQAYCSHLSASASMRLGRDLGTYLRMIEHPLEEIDRMRRQADRLYNSINHLLDLKQKHASAIEARFAREQADDTAQQSQLVLVFTFVTSIFLPLSFIASFFDLPIAQFPQNQSGETEMSLAYVSKYVFGVGLGCAFFFVTIVLNYGHILGFIATVRSQRHLEEDDAALNIHRTTTDFSLDTLDPDRAKLKAFGLLLRSTKLHDPQTSAYP